MLLMIYGSTERMCANSFIWRPNSGQKPQDQLDDSIKIPHVNLTGHSSDSSERDVWRRASGVRRLHWRREAEFNLGRC